MSVLVTGGSGFVGINVIEEYLKRGETVVNYDCLPILKEAAESFDALPGTYCWEEGDVLDGKRVRSVLEEHEIDTIIHTAVITPNEEREKAHMRHILEINCCGTVELLQAAVACGIRRFVYVSSIALYGDTAHTAERLFENMTDLTPRSLYEISKFTSERLALRYKELHGLDLSAVRLGDVFGPWERPTGVRDTMSAPYQTLKMAREGKTAVLPRANRTSWVYSRDVAQAICAVAGRSGLAQDVFNISSSSVWSIEEWCRELKKRHPGFDFEINPARSNVKYHAETDNAVMDVTRLKEIAGYQPCFGLAESLEDYEAWADTYGYLMQ